MPDAPEPPSRPLFEESNAMVSRIGRLPENSAVRRCALGLIPRQPSDTIEPLMQALSDTSPEHWREREVAAWALGRADLSPLAADVAAAVLLDVLENVRRPRLWPGFRHAFKYSSLATVAGVVALCLMLGPPPTPDDLFAGVIPLELLGLALVPVVTHVYAKLTNPYVRAAAATALGHLRAPKSVGALAGALFDGSPRVREAAASALHELLPTLTHDHYGQFGAQTMLNLGRALTCVDTCVDVDLVNKLLDALAKVGTSHAIGYVEQVVRRGRSTLLRDRAAEVLDILRERQQRESQRDRLLRPTAAPDDPASMLLRPAREGEPADERVLLRPIRGDEEPG